MTLMLLLVLASSPLAEAKDLLAKGEFKLALAAAGKVPERDAGYARARYIMGEVNLLLGDLDEAAAAFRAALKSKPNAEPVLTGLGRVLLAQEAADEALPVLEKAVKANAKSGRAHVFLGLARHEETFGKNNGDSQGPTDHKQRNAGQGTGHTAH